MRCCAAGAGRICWTRYEIERRPVARAQRHGLDREPRAHAVAAHDPQAAAGSVSRTGPRATPPARTMASGTPRLMRHEWFMNGYPSRLSLRRFADRLARRHAGAAARGDATYTQTARPGARAPHVWLPDGRSTLDLFGRGFVAAAPRRRCAGGGGLAAAPPPSAGVPLRVVALDAAGGSRGLRAAALSWCGPMAMSPGAADAEPPTPRPSSTSCAGAPPRCEDVGGSLRRHREARRMRSPGETEAMNHDAARAVLFRARPRCISPPAGRGRSRRCGRRRSRNSRRRSGASPPPRRRSTRPASSCRPSRPSGAT